MYTYMCIYNYTIEFTPLRHIATCIVQVITSVVCLKLIKVITS